MPQADIPSITINEIAAIIAAARVGTRHIEEHAGIGSVIVRLFPLIHPDLREQFLKDCGVLDQMYWLLGPDYPCPVPTNLASGHTTPT
jgi:hypothetical protein